MFNKIKNNFKKYRDIPYLKEFSGFTYGYFISAIFSFLIISSVNKLLEPSEMGKYSYLKSIYELLYSVLSLSIYSSYLRFNIKGENKKLTRIVLFIVLISTVILAIIIGVTLECILCTSFSLVILYNERIYYFRSLLDIKKLNWVRITPAIITLGIIYLLSYVQNKELNSRNVFIAYGIGYSFVLFFFRYNKYKIDDSFISYKKIFAYCVPSVGLIIVDWILNLSSQVLIKGFFSYTELANYAIAQRLLLVVKLFSGLFLMFYPMIYFKEIKNRNRNFISNSRNIILITMLLVILVFFIFSKYIYILMGAESYILFYNVFRILLFSEFFKVVASILGLFLSYKIQTYKNLIILSIGSILNIVLLYLFLEEYGIEFAAYTNLLSNILICILYLFFSYKPELKYLKYES